MLDIYAQYPTFTVFLGLLVSVVLTMALMPLMIRVLRKRHIGQQVRADGPETHYVKQGTPTMGGVVLIIAAAITALLLCEPTPEIWLLLAATLLTALLGFTDDSEKVIKQRSLGLTPKAKLAAQFVIASSFCLVAVNVLNVPPTIDIPFVCTFDLGVLTTVVPVGDGFISIPWLYLIFVNLLMAGMSNATNLTDGLDGLAGGTVMMAMLVMAAIAYRMDMLGCSVFAAALAGACIGFLWFNAYPADIFMGDTGSLALGTALAGLAVLTKTEIVVLVVGGLFIAEALSVIIATGARHRLLGLAGEENLIGEGISFCAVCDGAFYEGKTVGVVGGGNSALQEALLLSELAEKVYVIQNLDDLTGEVSLREQLRAKDNVEILLGTVVKELHGEDELCGVTVSRVADGAEDTIALDGLFIAIGLVPQNEPFAELVTLDARGYVASDEECTTNVPGIFTAGDCRHKRIRQVATAAADGAVAALAACDFVDTLKK
jgi:phospho-N-acetylmuramoyl-pentapeptide-transferase